MRNTASKRESLERVGIFANERPPLIIDDGGKMLYGWHHDGEWSEIVDHANFIASRRGCQVQIRRASMDEYIDHMYWSYLDIILGE